MAKIIVVTSGKGGVGKTTSSAAISTGLALSGHKTVVIDFDVVFFTAEPLLSYTTNDVSVYLIETS